MKQYFITYNLDQSTDQEKIYITGVYMSGEPVAKIDRAMMRFKNKLETDHKMILEYTPLSELKDLRTHEKGGKVMTFTQTFNVK
jgi:hypothetical protein